MHVHTNRERGQFVLLHVKFGQVVCPGKYAVRDAVTKIVLHIQVLQT